MYLKRDPMHTDRSHRLFRRSCVAVASPAVARPFLSAALREFPPNAAAAGVPYIGQSQGAT